jgi:hypothetical protein
VSDRRLVARALTFLVLFLAFFAAGANLERLTIRFGRLQPENYAALAREALNRNDADEALRYVERRLQTSYYDFNALYLLAEVYAKKGDFERAAQTIVEVFARVPGARANKVPAMGFDEPKTYFLLASYLWRGKHYDQAAEMLRAALDAGYPVATETMAEYTPTASLPLAQAAAVARIAIKTRNAPAFLSATDALLREKKTYVRGEILRAEWTEKIDRNPVGAEMLLRGTASLFPGDPSVPLALTNLYSRTVRRWPFDNALRRQVSETTGVKVIGAGLFKLSPGLRAEPVGLAMGRNGKATAEVSTGAFKVTRLIVNAMGTWALGLYPVVVVRVDNREVARLYLDEPEPHLYDLELWPEGAPKDMTLEFEFVNDAYEPLSRADRNAVIHDVVLY